MGQFEIKLAHYQIWTLVEETPHFLEEERGPRRAAPEQQASIASRGLEREQRRSGRVAAIRRSRQPNWTRFWLTVLADEAGARRPRSFGKA